MSDVVFATCHRFIYDEVSFNTETKSSKDKGMVELRNDNVAQAYCTLIFLDRPVHCSFDVRNTQREDDDWCFIFTRNTRTLFKLSSIKIVVFCTTHGH